MASHASTATRYAYVAELSFDASGWRQFVVGTGFALRRGEDRLTEETIGEEYKFGLLGPNRSFVDRAYLVGWPTDLQIRRPDLQDADNPTSVAPPLEQLRTALSRMNQGTRGEFARLYGVGAPGFSARTNVQLSQFMGLQSKRRGVGVAARVRDGSLSIQQALALLARSHDGGASPVSSPVHRVGTGLDRILALVDSRYLDRNDVSDLDALAFLEKAMSSGMLPVVEFGFASWIDPAQLSTEDFKRADFEQPWSRP